ncbi:2'-hydroxybiphenyl-2-sulfinate desulfinase [Streptosporangium becharense]|uniref:2'-hydroxybiphenyl-2-sulfinate desulfinase n=1 Tax=Streptosporangium becharense TaxID=1816182 RepID=A0A7W9IJ87_9ACTN|nr:ABC transporter substrate-binding protein [Streptosporangium becharense]MBB2911227.1 2'-hydroxybiphenyl-2-sulfinate desulfinase [Streptosporangium becharense]MBB5821715.1 2'-hydroxybiphenyl-2-sulfinate desulfinase [Streptosporangium becharense]
MSTVEKIWFTRCPVPTASGLALSLGWLDEEFGEVGVLQDAGPELAGRHFDHRLPGLFREGGNVPALVARSEGARTRLIGLTWIEEWQSILVRPESGVTDAAGLRGARVALPRWAGTRARSFPRAMALHGVKGALAQAGLTLDDVTFVEVEQPETGVGRDASGRSRTWPGLRELADGVVDAVYVKGARSAEQARELGAVVAVDLDAHPDRRTRVNNGTPRPITVHEDLLAEHPDLVVAFLVRTLRAADWAAGNLEAVRDVLAAETGSGAEGVATAYRGDFHRHLHPDLSAERLDLLRVQKDFLLLHGFLAADVDVEAWAAHEPLATARARLAAENTKNAQNAGTGETGELTGTGEAAETAGTGERLAAARTAVL